MVYESGKTNMTPLFEAYGAACFWAQHLERSFKILLLMARSTEHQTALFVSTPLDTEEGLLALGKFFKGAQEKALLTEIEHKVINKAISDRKTLIHAYWDKKSLMMLTPQNRQQIIDDLAQIRKSIRYAVKITNSLIDKKLKKHRNSLKGLDSAIWQEWENDQEKMGKLLRSVMDSLNPDNIPHH